MAQARIRTIKPDLWESERLGKKSALARLSFVGLMSLADDEGRGRASGRFLLGRIHPYAKDISLDQFETALRELAEVSEAEAAAGKRPIVVFYSVAGDDYYFLPGWYDHQKIDRPSESQLPPPPGVGVRICTDIKPQIKKPPRVQAEGKPWLAIRDLWNEIAAAVGFPKVKEVGAGRERHFKARWNEHPDAAYWREVLVRMAGSNFMTGKNKNGWRATIDFILRPDSATKILEGAYDNRGGIAAGAAAPKAGKYQKAAEPTPAPAEGEEAQRGWPR